jgi:hypothetical protein
VNAPDSSPTNASGRGMLEPTRPHATRRSRFAWKPSVRRRVPHTLGFGRPGGVRAAERLVPASSSDCSRPRPPGQRARRSSAASTSRLPARSAAFTRGSDTLQCAHASELSVSAECHFAQRASGSLGPTSTLGARPLREQEERAVRTLAPMPRRELGMSRLTFLNRPTSPNLSYGTPSAAWRRSSC